MLIRDQAEFEKLIDGLASCKAIGLDTEFIRERTYRPRLCLIQLSDPGGVYAIDPFEVKNLDPLWELVEDPAIVKVVHAGYQDMEIHYSSRRRTARNVFDTQVAAALLGYGDSIGYSKLVDRVLSVRLSKGETYTDWAQRPLRPRQIEYALDDVRHLLPALDILGSKLRELGREAWLEEELKSYERSDSYDKDPARIYLRVKGAGKLNSSELAVLRELAAWRERAAEERDRPRSRIIADNLMVEIARSGPERAEDLGHIRGLQPRFLSRNAEEIVGVIRRGLACPKEERPPVVERRIRDEKMALVVDLMEIVLKSRAASQSIGPGYLSSRSELYEIASAVLSGREYEQIPVFQGWRRELVGEDLLDLLSGNIELRIDPKTSNIALKTTSG